MTEKLRIKNFGGLKDVAVELKAINIFIGKQASGKSVTAKLFYFFKSVLDEILKGIVEKKSKGVIEQKLREKFENYFPPESWPSGSFIVRYEFGDNYIELARPARKLNVSFANGIKDHFKECRTLVNQDRRLPTPGERFSTYPSAEFQRKYYDYVGTSFGSVSKNNQVFVPAGRSFFTSLQSGIFSLLANNKSIDPFILEFGSFYESFSPMVIRDLNRPSSRSSNVPFFSKRIKSIIEEIIDAKILREDDKVYLDHADGRKVQLPFTSSGQQETLPLSLMLAFFSKSRFVSGGSTVYIEEPEAHLFPTAQKKMVELIATVFNESISQLQFVITTHSPYILTSFNNLLHAGFLSERGVDANKLNRIVSKTEQINPNEITAVAMQKGKVVNLIEKDSGLISAEILDQVSEDITVEFDHLLAI